MAWAAGARASPRAPASAAATRRMARAADPKRINRAIMAGALEKGAPPVIVGAGTARCVTAATGQRNLVAFRDSLWKDGGKPAKQRPRRFVAVLSLHAASA